MTEVARQSTAATDGINNSSFPANSFGNIGTIAIWFAPNWNSGDSVNHWLFYFGDSIDEIPGIQRFSDNNIYAGFNDATGGDQRIVIADTGLFSSGVWSNWVITWSIAAGQTLYKDGVSKGTHAFTGGNTTALGATALNSVSFNNNAAASVADFAVWSVILSPTEIAALAAGRRANAIGENANLKLYWPILGQSPEPDLSGGGYNGTVTGTSVVSGPPTLDPLIAGSLVFAAQNLIIPLLVTGNIKVTLPVQ